MDVPKGFKEENNLIFGVRTEGLYEIKIHNPNSKNSLT